MMVVAPVDPAPEPVDLDPWTWTRGVGPVHIERPSSMKTYPSKHIFEWSFKFSLKHQQLKPASKWRKTSSWEENALETFATKS